MPIKKLIPKVPDPYIPKTDQAQHWPACFGHINYLIEEINNNPSGGTTNSTNYSEEIIITGTQVAAGLFEFDINTPQMNQLIADGKCLVVTGGTVIVSLATPHVISATAVPFYIGRNDGVQWKNCFIVTGGQNYFPVGGSTVSSIQYKAGNTEATYNVTLTGIQKIQVTAIGGLALNPADNIKIILEYKAVDISWILNP
jgi:hypothetical protein